MKKVYLMSMGLVMGLFLAACGGGEKPVETSDAETPAETSTEADAPTASTYNVDAVTSTVEWTGSKVAYKHSGTIAIQSGELTVENDAITGGKFVLDMASIVEGESTSFGPEKSQELAGHLKSGDFFNVDTFATSEFVITEATAGAEAGQYELKGNLTIKGVTKNITIPATVSMDGDNLKAASEFTIDRTDWDIVYGSGTKFTDLVADNIIDDNISFNVKLQASK